MVRILINILLVIVFLSSCENRPKIEVHKYHDYVVSGLFEHGMPEGEIKYFSTDGHLLNKILYKNGIKSGLAISYFLNGRPSNVGNYTYNLRNGQWDIFDSLGSKIFSTFYLNDFNYGPQLYYDKESALQKFDFLSFNKYLLARCYYSQGGTVDSLSRFKMGFNMIDNIGLEKNEYNIFAYLPQIPGLHQTFSLGIIDSLKREKQICIIQGKNFLLDTLVSIPPKGSHYYLSCLIQNNNMSLNKAFMEEFFVPE